MILRQKRVIYVIAGLLVMLFAGFVYAWSILSAPIAVEFAGWTSARLAVTFTVCMAFFCLSGLAGGILLNHVTPAFNVRLAAALFLAGFLLTSRAQSLVGLYLGYGVLCGTASGFAYNAVMSTVPKWFPGRQGLISGILLMGFGAGSMIIGSVFTALTPEAIGAWRNSLLFMGILMAAVLTACSFLMRLPAAGAETSGKPEFPAGAEFSTGKMLRQPGCWYFFLWAALLSAAGLAGIGQARPIVLSITPKLSAGTVSLVVGMISVCNGLGRILIGAMFDRFGQKATMFTVVALFLAGAGGIAGAAALDSFPLLMLGYVLLGLGYGGGPTTGAWLIRAFYGSKYYSVNFSIANLNLIIASFGSTVAGALYDSSGSYASTFVFLIVCILAALAALFGVRRPAENMETTVKERDFE